MTRNSIVVERWLVLVRVCSSLMFGQTLVISYHILLTQLYLLGKQSTKTYRRVSVSNFNKSSKFCDQLCTCLGTSLTSNSVNAVLPT